LLITVRWFSDVFVVLVHCVSKVMSQPAIKTVYIVIRFPTHK